MMLVIAAVSFPRVIVNMMVLVTTIIMKITMARFRMKVRVLGVWLLLTEVVYVLNKDYVLEEPDFLELELLILIIWKVSSLDSSASFTAPISICCVSIINFGTSEFLSFCCMLAVQFDVYNPTLYRNANNFICTLPPRKGMFIIFMM